ncbi:RHS repeat protein, partial [Nostoc ellipsosporum NOK]|nr:RHS repeat protein [Nostoc ellipsosporum NOK]
MVAIFTGAGTGFERGSGSALGSSGLLGSASVGRGGEQLLLNAATGNLLISRQDEFLVGRGPDVAVSRTYNSLGDGSDDNGDNWLQSTDRKLFGFDGALNAVGSVVRRRAADGSVVTYVSDGTAYRATNSAGIHDKVTYDGSWHWSSEDGRIVEDYGYWVNGYVITRQTDTTSGDSLTFTYSGDKLTTVTTADGGQIQYSWSGNHITQVVSGDGTATRYYYDTSDRLSRVDTELTGGGSVYSLFYTYHGSSKLVATVSETDGSYVAIGYDGSNRVTSLAQAVAAGDTRTTTIAYGAGYTIVTDPTGQATTLQYDNAGQLVQITAPPAQAGVPAQIVRYIYDSQGNLTNILSGTASLPVINGANTTVTAAGNDGFLISKTGGTDTYDALAYSSQSIAGDFVLRLKPSQNNRYFFIGVSQQQTTNSWTDIDCAVEFVHNGYLYYGQNGGYGTLGQTYGAGETFWMVRSGSTVNVYRGTDLSSAVAAGALKSFAGVSGSLYLKAPVYGVAAECEVSFAPVSISSFTYDANGNQLTATDRLGNIVTRTYSATNQLLTETRTGSDKDSWASAHTTRYVYDSANRLRFMVSAEGDVTEYRYNGYGQKIYDIAYTGQVYDQAGSTEGDLVAWRNALSDPTAASHVEYLYHANGTVSHIYRYAAAYSPGSPHVGEGYSYEVFSYDSAGRLITSTVAGQNTLVYAYDGLGRVTSRTDLNGGTTSIVFNDASTQTVITLANGFVQTSTYNKAGELVSFTESGEAVAGGTAQYGYDKNGRLRVVTDATGLRTYHLYDKLGRKIADIDASGYTSEYRYDTNDRLIATIRYGTSMSAGIVALLANPDADIDLASVRPAANEYDIRTWSVYDKEGRLIEAIEGDGSVTAYEYDASGRLVKTTGYANKLSSGQIASFQAAAPTSPVLPAGHAKDSISYLFYDKDGRKIGVMDGEGYLTRTIYDGAGRKVQEIAYANPTYVPWRGNSTFQTLIDTTQWPPSTNDRSTRYVYDGQDLLRYTIDALGQVTEYGYGTGAAAIGLVRQTTRYAATISALSSYSYASVKAAVAALASDPANRTSFAIYDDAGRLAYAIDAAGAVVGYSYDIRGQMVRKVDYATPRPTASLPGKGDMDGWASGATTANDRITRYYYSARGELRYTVDAEGYVTGYVYDAEGRKIWEGRWGTPIAATDSWSIYMVATSVGGEVSARSYAYDPAGRLSLTTDGEGGTRRYYYHANGLLAWDIVSEGGQDDSRTYYTYDAAGRKASVYAAYGTAEQAIT